MNNLIFYKKNNEYIISGIVVGYQTSGERVAHLMVSGTCQETQKKVSIQFWKNETAAQDMYTRLKKANVQIGSYLIVKAVLSKEGQLMARDFSYAANIIKLSEDEGSIIAGKISEKKDFEKCIQIIIPVKRYQNGELMTAWTRITFYKNLHTADILKRLNEKDMVLVKCSKEDAYKGNPAFVGEYFEHIQTNQLFSKAL